MYIYRYTLASELNEILTILILYIMKTFTIQQALDFVKLQSPFNSEAIRSISYSGNSQNKFRIGFNDDTMYYFDLDNETYFKL